MPSEASEGRRAIEGRGQQLLQAQKIDRNSSRSTAKLWRYVYYTLVEVAMRSSWMCWYHEADRRRRGRRERWPNPCNIALRPGHNPCQGTSSSLYPTTCHPHLRFFFILSSSSRGTKVPSSTSKSLINILQSPPHRRVHRPSP